MDLLHKRYASPFPFMDGMIKTCRFSEFVDSFLQTVSKEKEEETTWEYFLHRVWDKSFKAFTEEIKTDEQNQEMSVQTIETTINESLAILHNFKPEQNGGED